MSDISVKYNAETFSNALDVMRAARLIGLSASYWPYGGKTPTQLPVIDIIHNVIIIGDRATVEKFLAGAK